VDRFMVSDAVPKFSCKEKLLCCGFSGDILAVYDLVVAECAYNPWPPDGVFILSITQHRPKTKTQF